MTDVKDILRTRAIGQFLAYYERDLEYFKMFQEFKKTLDFGEYCKSKRAGGRGYSLYSYIDHFNVKRDVISNMRKQLWEKTLEYVDCTKPNTVDYLIDKLIDEKIITYRRVSLCSKVMMLMQPAKFFPFDEMVKTAIEYKAEKGGKPNYVAYLSLLRDVSNKKGYFLVRDKLLKDVKRYTDIIELSFKSIGKARLKSIRENRMLDKLLWVIGENKKRNG